MYNYTPVISYDTNYGPREFIDHHENGLIIEQYNVNELAQSIIYLANNPEIAEEYGRKAHETMINKFSEDIILKKWEEVLNKAYINHHMKLLNSPITQENKKYKNINVKPLKKENVINENIEDSPSFISKLLSKNKEDSNKLKREYVNIRHKVTVIVDCRRKKKNDIIKLVNSMIKGSLKPSLIELVLITGEYMKVDYLYEVTKQYTNVHIMDINSNESIYEKVLAIIRTGYVLFINNIPSRNTLLEAYGKLVNGYDVVLINDINNFDMYSIENKLMKTEVFTNKNIIIDNNDVLTFNKDMFMDLNINKEDMLEYFLYDNNESREGIISTIRDNFINTNGPFKNDVFNRLKENVYKIIQKNRYDILINNSDKHRAFIEYITLSINKDDNKLKKLQDNISIDTPVTVLICINDNPINEVTQLLNIILRQSIEFEHLEIIFINNNSGTKTTERIKECCETYWNVKQIYLKTKHTIAECYNKGVDVTTSQYIILANKDHVLPNCGIKNIFRAIRKDNMNIAVGKTATKEENIYTYLFKTPYMKDNNIKFVLDNDDIKLSPDIDTLRGVVNSDTIVTKK